MVYDFGSLTERTHAGMCESTRSCSSSEAEFEIEYRPALVRGKKKCDEMSTSLRGRPRSTRGDAMSTSLRDRPRSTSAARRFTAVIGKMNEKNKKELSVVDVGVELMDDDDDDIDIHENGSNNTKLRAKDKAKRPQVLRAPSFAGIHDPIDTKVVETTEPRKEITHSNHSLCRKTDNSSFSPKRIWPHHTAKLSMDSLASATRAPSSPLERSPPKSPRRLWTKSVGVANAKIPPLGVIGTEKLSPPSAEILRHSSPIKSFSQRAIGSILRSRKKPIDNHSDPKGVVPDDLCTHTTNSNDAPPSSPTKRAITGILRACSLHDRSSPAKIASANDSNNTMHANQPRRLHLSSHDDVERKSMHNSSKNRGEPPILDGQKKNDTAISSASERGTRSSARLIDDDNASNYSRTVTSLVSPSQTSRPKLRKPSLRESGNGEKHRNGRAIKRDDDGCTSSRTHSRSRSRSTRRTKVPTSPQNHSNFRSNDNSKVSTGENSPKNKENKPSIRTTSRSRSRKMSTHPDRSDHAESTKRQSSVTPNDDRSEKQDGRKTISKRSSSRQNKPSVHGEEGDDGKSSIHSSSHRYASDTVADHITPRSSRSGVKVDGRESSTRTYPRRILSDLQVPIVDDPTTPRSSTPSRSGEDSCVKRSRRQVSDAQVLMVDAPKTPRSRRSGSSVSAHNRRPSSSRSVSSSVEGMKSSGCLTSSRNVSESEIQVFPLHQPPESPSNTRISTASRSEHCKSLTKSLSCRPSSSSSRSSRLDPKSPIRKKSGEGEQQACTGHIAKVAESQPENGIEIKVPHAHESTNKQNVNCELSRPKSRHRSRSTNTETNQEKKNEIVTPRKTNASVGSH